MPSNPGYFSTLGHVFIVIVNAMAIHGVKTEKRKQQHWTRINIARPNRFCWGRGGTGATDPVWPLLDKPHPEAP